MTISRRDVLALSPALAFVVLFALVPAVVLFASTAAAAGGLGGIVAIVSSPLNVASIENSLEQGSLSATLAVALGYPAGVFFGRYAFPGRDVLRSLLLVPFLLPSLIVVFGVLDLFGADGVLSSAVPWLGTFGSGLPAIVVANLAFNVPVVVLFTSAGCESAPRDLEETVASLGGSPGRAYVDVWGAPTWVGAAAGGLLTFLFSSLSFAPPLLLCGPRCYTVEARIWSLASLGLEPTAAGVLALAMVGLFLLPTGVYLALLGRLRGASGRARPRQRSAPTRSVAGIALAAETALVVGSVVVLLAAVLDRTLAPIGGRGPGSAWVALFSNATTARLGVSAVGLVANTLLFATGAAVVALLLGIVLGFAVQGRTARAGALGLVLFVPLLLSPVVLAIALAEFWRPLLGGAPNVWILVIVSQAVLALPFALQSIEIPLSGLSPSVREGAEALGASRWVAFVDADLPRVRDGLATAGLFAFALGLGEFTATNFLVTARLTTLPVALYELADSRLFAVADAAAGLLLLLSLAVFLVIAVGGRRVEL